MGKKRGQVTIFVIIAMIILASVLLVLVLKPSLFTSPVPASIQPAYNTFLSCLEDDTLIGIDLLESQAGYIELPEYKAGSPYIPFSSQLNFLGNSIPYWYYLSGNNIPLEEIPSKTEMESQLKKFVKEKIRNCNLESYYEEGFEITQDEPNVEVNIRENSVLVNLYMNLEIKKGEDEALIKTHEIAVNSKLGTLYNSARTLYEKEKKEMFLEEYGTDVIRLYAPVDGIELSCSPKTWNAYDIFSSLKEAIELNTLALSTQIPSDKQEKYFYVDTSISEDARFITSQSWPMSFEVLPSEGDSLVAKPIGNQQGLGIIGFCYVPYHFVYNFNYPVLVQVYDGEEVFQFPIAVVIKGNQPRNALNYTSLKEAELELCPYKNTPTTIKIIDSSSNFIDADISYECFGESCYIGKTTLGILTEDFPQCVNGFIEVKAEGFAGRRYQYSTITEGSAEIILDKLYEQELQLKIEGVDYDGDALIYLTSEENSQTLSYPNQKKINLSQGDYNISVYIYKNSSIKLGETSHQECIDVPSTGILGIFGATEENCFSVKIPSQLISNVLTAGGSAEFSFDESELRNSNFVELNTDSFEVPSSIEELQNNYFAFESSELEVILK